MTADARLVPYEGRFPEVGPEVFIADTARVIGDVTLGEGASVWYGAVIRGDVYHIRIGPRVNVQDLSVIHVTTGRYPTIVESDVTIGHRAVLHGCTVRKGALIGMGALILDQADIGEGAMIAAGALVTPRTKIAPHALYAGVPARRIRDLTPKEQAEIAWSASHYCDLAASYRRADLERGS